MTSSSSLTSLTVLVVGSGGREHALAWAAKRSPRVGRVLVAPGNGGTPGERVAVAVDDVAGIVALCQREVVDLVIVGPEAALAAGLADALAAAGVTVFGPSRAAARLEWSKAHTRQVAARLGIPSPRYGTYPDAASALVALDGFGGPVVVKASGLAGGKGVIVPADRAETEAAIRTIAALGELVLEERLTGWEVSLLAFCDGRSVAVMPPAKDHKRIGEGDTGPNTGGMGAFAPAAGLPGDAADLAKRFIQPVIDDLAAAGTPFVGVLYAGLLVADGEPKLLEYNCRFGDPETQAIIPLLESDLIDVVLACVDGRLHEVPVRWRDGAACTVVLAAPGYPGAPALGGAIDGLGALGSDDDTSIVFHAGTELAGSLVVTAGGRVLGVTGLGPDLAAARANAYRRADAITFPGRQVRRDIGWREAALTAGTYADAGVDITAGNEAVALMKAAVERTHGPAVLRGVGAFGGAFDASVLRQYDAPVLVASTDGVGTKVELVAATGRFAVAGHDIVNHCINDVLVQRARPLFFLDYIASSRLHPDHVAAVVGGMAAACEAAGCALLGGETAEMPGVYSPGAFDIAGTLVGVVERDRLLPRTDIAPGDVLLGLASSGPHTNGYSLLRKLFAWLPLDAQPDPLDVPLADALLQPHRNYLPVLWPVLETDLVKALVHITGGGLPENLPRVLPTGCGARVELGTWPVPPLFRLVRQVSTASDHELHRTLNMGVGMVLVVAPEAVAEVRAAVPEEMWIIGAVTAGSREVELV